MAGHSGPPTPTAEPSQTPGTVIPPSAYILSTGLGGREGAQKGRQSDGLPSSAASAFLRLDSAWRGEPDPVPSWAGLFPWRESRAAGPGQRSPTDWPTLSDGPGYHRRWSRMGGGRLCSVLLRSELQTAITLQPGEVPSWNKKNVPGWLKKQPQQRTGKCVNKQLQRAQSGSVRTGPPGWRRHQRV